MLPTLSKGATACVDPTSRPATCSVICRPSSGCVPTIPLRAIRRMTDEVLASLSPRFTKMYSDIGRPSIPPEQLLRALLLQSLYTVRSERLLMEEIDYSVLYRWFVGLGMDDPIWSPTTFSKNRDRLLESDIAARSLMRWSARRATPACCPTSTSRSTARCWRRGPASRASVPRMKDPRRRRTIPAIRRSISTANRGGMTPISPRPIPMRCSRARARAKRRSSPTRAMSCSTIATAWWPTCA